MTPQPLSNQMEDALANRKQYSGQYVEITPEQLREWINALKGMEVRWDIGREIQDIMTVYRQHEKTAFGVDSPGGLEHMGDVWRLLGRWDELLTESPKIMSVNPKDEPVHDEEFFRDLLLKALDALEPFARADRIMDAAERQFGGTSQPLVNRGDFRQASATVARIRGLLER
jgi:hypothetical protein